MRLAGKGKEYEMAIRIAGVIDRSFGKNFDAAEQKISGTVRKIEGNVSKLDNTFRNLDKGFDSAINVGQNFFAAMAAAASAAAGAISGAAVMSFKAGSEFESAFAGVKKTVDAAEQEYAVLREDVLEMTHFIPSSAAEIAGVMEIAGQLGIERDSLTGFTETMINLGESTNMAAEDAATSLARFANIVSMADYGEDGISNWERLGSVVVDLGNHFATSESEIVEMSTRLASAGDLVGLTEAQIMAMSTAMSSVGIAEEVGGSTMGKLLKKMQIAVELNSSALQEYASVADMTGKEFADAFQTDAVAALSRFIDGLDDTERNGRSAIAILDDMGLNEIRLSNTILALSGAEGIMTRAIETANDAWDEHTALAVEAGKRYETVESQIQLAGNAVTRIGIEAYDEMRPLIVNALGEVTDKVHEFRESRTIQKWIRNISTEFPTLKRKFTKYAEPVFDGFLTGGKWIVKNGQNIISIFTGIGAALAAYKTASAAVHTASTVMSFFTSLNPAKIAIMGVTAAVGGLAGAWMAYKQHERSLIDDSLQKHFGNIALSMEELQAVAEHIISTESLEGVRKALEAFEELGGLSAAMDESVSEIDKMNWKLSVGIELSEEENESYKQAIDEYVSNAQEYAMQSQYAVAVNMQFAFSEDDLESQNIVDKVNQFYSDKYDELASLGTRMNEALTNAFSDGLLEFEETETIVNLQRQMAEVEKSLATGEFEAQMSLIGMEYAGGGSLTADSFQNLMEEIIEQEEAATEKYHEAYVKNYASLMASFEGGYLEEAEYSRALEELELTYLSEIGELKTNGINFLLDTIQNQYADELNPAIESYMQRGQDTLASYMENGENDWASRTGLLWMGMVDEFSESDLDKTTRLAIGQLLDPLEPLLQEMRELERRYDELGGNASESFKKGLSDFALLDVLSNQNMESANYILSEQLPDSEYYDDFYKGVIERADEIYGIENLGYFDQVTSEIKRAAAADTASEIAAVADSVIRPVVSDTYDSTQKMIDEYYSRGFQTNADLAVTLNARYGTGLKGSAGTWKNADRMAAGIDHNATGGIIRNEELSWLAENGPEAVVPLDGSQRAIALWEKTGQLLGMDSVLDRYSIEGGSQSTVKIEYNPTLQFYGEAPDKADLTDALRISQDEFDSHMEQWMKKRGRVSFG